MSAAPIHSPSSVDATTGSPPPPNSVNYLNRCVENISTNSLKHHKSVAQVNRTIAVASAVLYIAAAIASIALTAIFSPASIPITSLSVFFMLDPVQKFISSRLSVAKTSDQAAEVCFKIAEIRDRLPSESHELNERLRPLGASVNNQDIDGLKSLLAHYTYWHELSQHYQTESANRLQEQQDHTQRYPTELNEITQIRLEHLAYEEASLIAKTNAAFYLAILRQPSYGSEQSNVLKFGATVDALDPSEDFIVMGRRAFAEQFGDKTQKTIVAIKNRSDQVTEYDKADLKAISESDIANFILA